MQDTVKKAGALAGMALMASAAMVAPAALAAPDVAEAAGASAAAEAKVDTAALSRASVQAYQVAGDFMYSQTPITGSATIQNVFSKAAAVLCQALPSYSFASTVGEHIAVTSPDVSFATNVGDMAAEEGATSTTLTCSCASNTAGGGAIASAKVQGVSFASVAAQANAL